MASEYGQVYPQIGLFLWWRNFFRTAPHNNSIEQKQVSEHYQTMIARIEDGKIHKGSDPEHLNARIRAIHADQELRLQDLEKRYRLVIEITLTQLALVSYLKAAVPLRLQQGKEIRSGMAIWDSFTRQGYVTEI